MSVQGGSGECAGGDSSLSSVCDWGSRVQPGNRSLSLCEGHWCFVPLACLYWSEGSQDDMVDHATDCVSRVFRDILTRKSASVREPNK